MSAPTVQDFISYLKKHPLKTVRIKGWHQLVSPNAKVVFACAKSPMIHGEFWENVSTAQEREEEGRSACPMCYRLEEDPADDVVAFASFKTQVEKQRSAQSGVELKAKQKLRGGGAVTRYAAGG
jgi:hypothetical protein